VCGGFFEDNYNGQDYFNGFYVIGVTPKGSAGKCYVFEPLNQKPSTPFYALVNTMHIAGCAGAN
jgi:hypothetical protein